MVANEIEIVDMNSLEDMMHAFPLMQKIYPKLTLEAYRENVSEMIEASNFCMIGAIYQNKLIGVSGYWVMRMLYCGRYLQASSLAVYEEYRALGVGRKLLSHLERIARSLECDKLVLDSYVENKKSHSLYFSENFYIRGFHFMKDL